MDWTGQNLTRTIRGPEVTPCRERIASMSSRTERANAIRTLTLDAVDRANSGHAGAPMGMADIAEVLWREVLRHNPSNPAWWQ